MNLGLKCIVFIVLYLFCTFFVANYAVNLNYLFESKLQTAVVSVVFVALPFILAIFFKKCVKSNNCSRKQRKSLAVFCFIFALFLIYSFNIYKHNPQKPYNVAISTTFVKNPLSSDTKLYLYKYPKADNVFIKDNVFQYSGKNLPEYKSHRADFYVLSNDDKQKNEISFSGKANKLFFIFMGCEHTGIAEITINDKKYYFDTYQNISADKMTVYNAKILSIPVDNNLTIQELFRKTLYVLLCFCCFFFSAYFLGRILIEKSLSVDGSISTKIDKKQIVLFAMPSAIAWLFILFVFYPGIVPFDSLNQLHQCNTYIFDNHHPIFHTYLMFLLSYFHKGPLCICLFQIVCFSLLIGFFFEKFSRYGIHKALLYVIAVILAVMPLNAIMSITVLKDFLFSTGVLGLTLCTFSMFVEKNQFFLSKPNVFVFVLSLILVSFIRYNGFLISFLFLLLLLIIFKNYKKFILNIIRKYVVWFFLIIFCLSFVKTSDCNHRVNQALQLAMHQVQTVLFYHRNQMQDVEKSINSLISTDKFKNIHSKYTSHTLIFESELTDKEIDAPRFIAIWLKLIPDNGFLMLKDYVMLNSYILKYRHNPEGFNYSQYVFLDVENDNFLTEKSGFTDNSIKRKSFFPNLHNKIHSFIDAENFYDSLFKPTPYFLIFLFLGMIFGIKNGRKSFSVLLPVFLNLFILSLTLPEMSPRYVLFLFFTAPFWVLFSFIKVKK